MLHTVRWISCIIILVSSISIAQTTLTGRTLGMVNMRGGPGTGFNVVAILPINASVRFVGRNQSGTWLQAEYQGQVGWLTYTFIQLDEGDVGLLPVTATTPKTEAPEAHTIMLSVQVEGLSGVVPYATQTVHRIFANGRAMGNHPDVFSKVGDSITATSLFLDPIGNSSYNLHGYDDLQAVINYFSQTSLRDHYSFANTSLSARSGWTTADVLDPRRRTVGICLESETPLECEYRVNQPAIALIMFGSNDIGFMPSDEYAMNLRAIVQMTIEHGVIPVLSTIPDQPGSAQAGRVLEFNQIIRDTARSFDVLLWDYWQALQGLPNQGISDDGIHPSYNLNTLATAHFSPDDLRYGYNMRNLTALMVLEAIWRDIIQ